MKSITSDAHFRQRVIRYSEKHGVTLASVRFRRSRQAIYEWIKKYDGNSWKSLIDKSHRPLSHPNQHTEEEKRLILNHWKHNKDDRIVLWDTLRKKGYTRQYNSMNRVLAKWLTGEEKASQKKKKPKPYQRAQYPGQKLQLDVKYVPGYCVANGVKYYQYTAIDECSRAVFREMYDEHSTYSSKDFLMKLINYFPFAIREIQTDNGTEWTTALLIKNPENKTLFEAALLEMDIKYHRIRVATPQHNGKGDVNIERTKNGSIKRCACAALEMAESSLKNIMNGRIQYRSSVSTFVHQMKFWRNIFTSCNAR